VDRVLLALAALSLAGLAGGVAIALLR